MSFLATASPVADAISEMRSVYNQGKKAVEEEVDYANWEWEEAQKEDPDFDIDTLGIEAKVIEVFNAVEQIVKEKILPFAKGLEIHRKEEKRKLSNFLQRINEMLRFLEHQPELQLSVLENFEDPTRPLRYVVDDLGRHVASLYRLRKRVDRYADLPREFPFDNYTVINKYGYTQEEVQKPLSYLATATQILRDKGFGDLAYGKVQLVDTPHRERESARYFRKGDYFRLQMKSGRRFSTVYTIIHELGHRYWYYFLEKKDREWYYDEFWLDAQWVSLQEREIMWKVLEESNFWPAKAQRILLARKREEMAAEVVARFKQALKMSDMTIKEMRKFQDPTHHYHTFFEGVKKFFLAPNSRDIPPVRKVKLYPSVTSYARTNVREDFAEAFTHYIFDKKIPQDQNMRLLGVLP